MVRPTRHCIWEGLGKLALPIDATEALLAPYDGMDAPGPGSVRQTHRRLPHEVGNAFGSSGISKAVRGWLQVKVCDAILAASLTTRVPRGNQGEKRATIRMRMAPGVG
jgi:hypothetical protein